MRFGVALSLLLTCATSLSAQWSARDSVRDDRNFTFYDHGPYRADIPRPESILGYAVGDMHTQFLQQEKVLLAIGGIRSACCAERRSSSTSRLDRENVVLFVNEPMFRGWWSALDHLVLNAILLGPARY